MHVVFLHIDLAFLVLLLSGPGSIATGDLHFLSIPHIDITSDDVSPTNSSSSHLGTLNPLSSNLDGGQSATSEVPAAATGSSGPREDAPVKKRKQSHVGLVLE